MVGVPQFVTHYHRADRRPFQNLGDLDGAELAEVLAGLDEPGSRVLSRRRFGPRYMALRRATEAAARELFAAAGGLPERRSPHYFVLGESAWFAGLYADVGSVRLCLDSMPAAVASFTLVDSITALGLGGPFGVPKAPESHQRQLYRWDELEEIVARHGLSEDSVPAAYAGHQNRPVDSYVEVQLWSDAPVAQWL